MMQRRKESAAPGRPQAPWLAGAMIGLTVSALAAGAMMLGAGLAMGQAAVTPRLPAP